MQVEIGEADICLGRRQSNLVVIQVDDMER